MMIPRVLLPLTLVASLGIADLQPADASSSQRDQLVVPDVALEECWSNPPSAGGGGINSEIVESLGLYSEAADDFMMEETRIIARARWWGRYYGGDGPLLTGFNIRVYTDEQCLPGDLFQEIIIPDNAGEHRLNGLWWYAIDFPFLAYGQERYWLSIQAHDHPWPPSWARVRGTEVFGCDAVYRSGYYSYPDWTPIGEVIQEQYDLALEMSCNPLIGIDHVLLDATEQANEPIEIAALITGYGIAIDPDAVWIEYRVDPSPDWSRLSMVYQGGGEWMAFIPGQPQPSSVAYYIHAENIYGGSGEIPEGGRDDPRQFEVAWEVDLFEEESGWIVDPDGDDDALEGVWERGQPESTFAQPPADHSSTGSFCWITGAAAGGSAYENDVDGGRTTLQSPPYDLTGAEQAVLKYWRWYTNHLGWLIDGYLIVRIRNNGGEWIDLENPVEPLNGWVLSETDLRELFGGDLGVVELRFVVWDEWEDSLVEAAIDDLVILVEGLDPAAAELLDPRAGTIRLIGGRPNPFRLGMSAEFLLPSEKRVDVTIYDAAGQRVCTLLRNRVRPAGLNLIRWDGADDGGDPVPSGVYFVRLDVEGTRLTQPVTLVR